MNPLIQGKSGTTPVMSRNAFSTNQGTNEDDSQSDPHPEAGIFGNQTMRSSGQKDRCDSDRSEQSQSDLVGLMLGAEISHYRIQVGPHVFIHSLNCVFKYQFYFELIQSPAQLLNPFFHLIFFSSVPENICSEEFKQL